MSSVTVKSNPVPTPTNPLGVKGCGEAGCVGAMPAVANAIVDALSAYGIRHIEMPATPEPARLARDKGCAEGGWHAQRLEAARNQRSRHGQNEHALCNSKLCYCATSPESLYHLSM